MLAAFLSLQSGTVFLFLAPRPRKSDMANIPEIVEWPIAEDRDVECLNHWENPCGPTAPSPDDQELRNITYDGANIR